MPKAKTHQATADRIRVKKSKQGIKFIKRHDGQDHFNMRDTGNAGRRKRSDTVMKPVYRKTITRALPNA